MRLAEFEGVIRVNLIGTFNTLRLAAAEMRGLDPDEDGERGVIINTASIAGYEGQVGQAAYAASKAGVEALTRTMALDHAREGIRVNCVLPGATETPLMWASTPPERIEAMRDIVNN